MKQLVKIGARYIRMDALDYIECLAADRLLLRFSDGSTLTLDGDEAEAFGQYLANLTQNGASVDVMRTHRRAALATA